MYKVKLMQWVSALGKRVDSERYHIGVRLAPRSRRCVIEIIEKANPEHVWYLGDQQQVLQWLRCIVLFRLNNSCYT